MAQQHALHHYACGEYDLHHWRGVACRSTGFEQMGPSCSAVAVLLPRFGIQFEFDYG